MSQALGRDTLVTIRPRPNTVQLSRGRTALISELDGEPNPERPQHGLYVYDTRVLSRYAWRMNGKKPEFSCGSNIQQSSWLGYFIQAPENWEDTPPRESDPLQQTVELRIGRSVGEGMHEDVHLTNHTQIATRVKLELAFEVQFVSQDEAESGRKQKGHLESRWSQPEPNAWELMNDYRVEHHYAHQGNEGTASMHRGIKLRIENATSAPEFGENCLSFHVELAPHGEWRACLSWLAYVEGKLLPLAAQCPLVGRSDWDERRLEFFNSATELSTPRTQDIATTVGRVLQRSRLDLGDLRMYDLDSPGGIALAAGVPTYMEIFGRDMQAVAWQASMLSPELLRGALTVLNKLPASEKNDWRDAEPGRLPHEIHTDPLSVLNFRPKSLYFGSVSGCFLFPMLLTDLWYWTGDLEAVRPYIDTAMGALQWADTYSLDSTGFYRYQTHSEQGVKNQGWKDSKDAIVYADGSQVETPIGTCEMQGLVYAAKLHFSAVMWRLGERDIALRLYRQAGDLKARFNDKFWMEDEGFIAMGIDSHGKLIRSIASDPVYCLAAGIVDEKHVKQVANRFLRPDMFSGWGVRTLSAEHPAFNPFSYHRGSVWPVANAGLIFAFARYGLHGEMHQLSRAFFETASLFEQARLPEVFGGHQRTAEQPFPGLYTRADWPQAWSASAPFTVLQSLLGILPYAPEGVLFLDPHLPEWLPEITVERLRVGKAVVTLRFSRTANGDTNYEVGERRGRLHIVRQPSPWSLTADWTERVADAVSSLIPHGRAKSA